MKEVILLILLFPSLVLASEITLEWDANTEPDIEKYRLYQSQISGVYGASVGEVTHPVVEYTIPDLPDGQYYWSVTAVDQSNNESGKSNEVKHIFEVGVPGAPQSVRKKIVIEIPIP